MQDTTSTTSSASAMETTPLATQPRVFANTHPLIMSKMTQLRLHDLPAKDFREGVKAIG